MAECRCFLNDELLPVRAGCEAIWCKDVHSTTAIRTEALARIAAAERKVGRAIAIAKPHSGKQGRYYMMGRFADEILGALSEAAKEA